MEEVGFADDSKSKGYILTFLVKCATIRVSEREVRFSFEDIMLDISGIASNLRTYLSRNELSFYIRKFRKATENRKGERLHG